MKRWRVRGRRLGWGDFQVEAVAYVNAPDRDAAVRKATGVLLQSIDEVVEVPHDEGRGWLWRLLRWLGVV